MTASSRRLIEISFLALLDSGIDYRGRKVGSFAAGTNAEALANVSQLRIFAPLPHSKRVCRSYHARTTSTTVISARGPTRLQIEWPILLI